MKWTIAMLAALSIQSAASAAGSSLSCEVGPAQRQFGQSQWNVYACADGKSVVVVPMTATKGEFGYYFVTPAGNEVVVTGEGWGKDASFRPSFEQIGKLTADELAALVTAAWNAGDNPQTNKTPEDSVDPEKPKTQPGD